MIQQTSGSCACSSVLLVFACENSISNFDLIPINQSCAVSASSLLMTQGIFLAQHLVVVPSPFAYSKQCTVTISYKFSTEFDPALHLHKQCREALLQDVAMMALQALMDCGFRIRHQ